MSTENKKKNLADLLRKHRQEHNLSGRALARKLGVNSTSLSSYLDGMTLPSEVTREKIAAHLGMTPAELEAKINDVPVKPLKQVDQIKQDVRALPHEDFLDVAEVVMERLLNNCRAAQ